MKSRLAREYLAKLSHEARFMLEAEYLASLPPQSPILHLWQQAGLRHPKVQADFEAYIICRLA